VGSRSKSSISLRAFVTLQRAIRCKHNRHTLLKGRAIAFGPATGSRQTTGASSEQAATAGVGCTFAHASIERCPLCACSLRLRAGMLMSCKLNVSRLVVGARTTAWRKRKGATIRPCPL